MKKKLKLLGKIVENDSDDEGDVMEDFKEFMKYRHMIRSDKRRTFAPGGYFDSDPLSRSRPGPGWDDAEWKDDTCKWNGTNYDEYCKMQDGQRSMRRQKYEEEKRKFAVKGRSIEHNGTAIDQSEFIITQEDQRKFDDEYDMSENTFQGKNAAVAGAFTGEHNVVFDEKTDDVKGVVNRVKAAIQHFNYDEMQKMLDERDKGKVVIYTTSLGVNRELIYASQQVVSIIRSYRVRFEERDIYINQEYKDDLYEKLGLEEGDPFPEMPRVYVSYDLVLCKIYTFLNCYFKRNFCWILDENSSFPKYKPF